MNDVADLRFKYVQTNRSRHGNVRYYYREPGKARVRLPDDPTSDEFGVAYRAARDEVAAAVPAVTPPRMAKGSFRALCAAYLGSVEFAQLAPSTQAQRRRVIDGVCQEPLKPGATETFAEIPVGALKAKHLRVLRDRKAAAPEAANHRMKLLRHVFAWAFERELIGSNPATGVKGLTSKGDGHHTWTVEEVAQYLEKHGKGSKARLALGLLLFTGVRISDLAILGPQHQRDGVHVFRPYKGRERSQKELHLPTLPELAAILSTTSHGHLTYMVTEYGKPFTTKGLGNKFRTWCDSAGLPHCSAHGLRKAGATIAAENGANEEDLKALFGWENAKEANLYTRKARQKVIAKRAITMIDFGDTVNKLIHQTDGVPSGVSSKAKKPSKINAR